VCGLPSGQSAAHTATPRLHGHSGGGGGGVDADDDDDDDDGSGGGGGGAGGGGGRGGGGDIQTFLAAFGRLCDAADARARAAPVPANAQAQVRARALAAERASALAEARARFELFARHVRSVSEVMHRALGEAAPGLPLAERAGALATLPAANEPARLRLVGDALALQAKAVRRLVRRRLPQPRAWVLAGRRARQEAEAARSREEDFAMTLAVQTAERTDAIFDAVFGRGGSAEERAFFAQGMTLSLLTGPAEAAVELLDELEGRGGARELDMAEQEIQRAIAIEAEEADKTDEEGAEEGSEEKDDDNDKEEVPMKGEDGHQMRQAAKKKSGKN
jgi:hypothetical protein